MSEVPVASRALRRLLFSLLVVAALTPSMASAQAIIKVNDNINIKFGTLMQAWGDLQQDAASRGYANNLFLRRFRFLVGGQISPTLSFFFETDNPNLGKTPKALNSGFITQDAFLEWKPRSSAFIVDAGLMLPPLCRNCLESAASLLSLDYGSFSFTEGAPTQSSVGRDTGFQAKGFLAGNHFEYRAAVFQGFRAPNGRNSLRTTGRLMYNPWETETGVYTYPGQYLGNKKVLSLGVGADHQADYKAYSADAFLSVPMGGASAPSVGTATTGSTGPAVKPAAATPRNAFNGELTLLRFDGGSTFVALPQQNDVTLQLGYYFAPQKLQPFVRLERQDFKAAANNGRDNNRVQAGLAWLPSGNNFNIKGAYSRVKARSANSTNQFTVQMQLFYY